MSNNVSPTITSLAILKVNWEKGRDYLEIFVPIVAESIRSSGIEIVTTHELQMIVQKNFGLIIPQNTLKTILMRVKKSGYIRQENHLYYPNHDKLSDLDSGFRRVQQQVIKMYEDLTEHFIRFCEESLQVKIGLEEADQAFQAYLNEDAFAIAGKNGTPIIPKNDTYPSKSKRFYVGAFIQHLETTHSSNFDSWETIVIGNMLANSVFLPEPLQPSRRFRKTSIYFDTPFLIYVLGYAGEIRKAPCIELLELLYEVGAELKCFTHTLDEAKGILAGCSYRIKQGQLKDAYGPSMEYFILNGFSASDIELFIVQLEQDLKSARIEIVDKPDYTEHLFVIDEKGLREALSAEILYRNQQALDRDVASISATARLRRGRKSNLVEECKAIFVSANSALARVSRQFLSDDSFPNAVAVCITDYSLTNMLWLKKPSQAPNLPRKKIIADYLAAIQPDEQTRKQYHEEAYKLSKGKAISQQDYYLLRYSLEAEYGMMVATHGGEDAITEITIKEALDYVQKKLTHEEREKLQEEVRLKEEARQQVDTYKASEIERNSRIKARGQRWSHNFIFFIRILITVVLTLTTITTFPWDFPPIDTKWQQYTITLFQIILLIISIINIMQGTAVEVYIRRFEIYLANRLEKVFHSLTN